MQFYDEVKIHIESGRWWDGLASGRREAGTPFGWPNGGDGGKWGDLIFEASKNENTLVPFRYRKIFKAEKWEPGRTKDQYGANWENTILIVPVWTLIKDEKWNVLWHLTKDKERRVALIWWDGWWWNIHFKDAVNQYPTFALLGEPAHQKEIILELQLLADVALIWSPSVWKSSLINSISHTKAKVADYEFTTLVPNLWSIHVWDYNFNMIDIPGLIKWASEWKWLWNTFLRHILKARVFCFVADLGRFDKWLWEITDLFGEIIMYMYKKIWEDLDIILYEEDWHISIKATRWEETLIDKKIIFAMNKYDLINDEEIVEEYKKEFLKNLNKFLKKDLNFEISTKLLNNNCFTVSAATHSGLENWTKHLVELLKKTKEYDTIFDKSNTQQSNEHKEYDVEMIVDITEKEKENLLDDWYLEEINSKYNKVWMINSPEVCKRTMITQWWNDEWEMYFWKKIEEKWFLAEFDNKWIKKWDVLKIKSYYETVEDRFIMY